MLHLSGAYRSGPGARPARTQTPDAPTPGGAGFSELAFAGLMAGRIEPAQLVTVIFVWRFLTIYLGMGIGAAISVIALRPGARRA